jgi:hypothetical protein
MTRRQLTLALLPVALLAVLAFVAIGFAWKIGQGLEDRTSKFAAVEQNARVIDGKAGIPAEASTSATAMAQALKASDDAEGGYKQFLQSLGILMLIVAAFQAAAIFRFGTSVEPSNPTVETDARKSSARGSL